MAVTDATPHNRITINEIKPHASLACVQEMDMYRGSYPWFKVVHRNKSEYAVWHAEAQVLTEWQETGRYGSVDDCWDYIEAKEGPLGYLLKIDNF